MAKRKSIRTRGKLPLSKYFQEFKEKDAVAVVRNSSIATNFPKRIQGNTGVVKGKRGKAYIVSIKDNNKPKTFLIEAIHLKKIKQVVKE